MSLKRFSVATTFKTGSRSGNMFLSQTLRLQMLKLCSEMFLGPAHKDFNFQPKHKSNSYEIEAEG